VTSSAQISFPQRVIGSEPKRGQVIAVETPTHISGVLDFAAGAVATLVTSFDVWASTLPRIEIYGSEGTLSCPDPNIFGGPVRLWRAETRQWEDVPLVAGRSDQSRGLGVADMAAAMRTGRPHRASGEMAFHVLDTMHALFEASRSGRHLEIASTCARPELL
jgi:predicted dehydrogenase